MGTLIQRHRSQLGTLYRRERLREREEKSSTSLLEQDWERNRQAGREDPSAGKLVPETKYGFLHFRDLSPCLLWNQQAPGGTGDWEDRAGVGDLLEERILAGRKWEVKVFTLRDSSRTSERRLPEEAETRL